MDDDETTDGEVAGAGYRIPGLGASPPVSRYRRGSEIARGGLGRVTEAYDSTLQRQVAIKELHHRTEQSHVRFQRESLTTARLQHPSVVSVFDAGTWESGEPFIVLQLLEGSTLAEEISRRATLDARLALLPNLLAIADALGYAHEQGVVHRDVKPSNIMLGKHGETVLLDWGVAADTKQPAIDGPDTLVGTPRFMSPAQALCAPPTPAFDVHSLGLTIAVLLAGEQPFANVEAAVILERLRARTIDVPALPVGAPADLVSIVEKAVALEGGYADASQIAADLRRFIAGQLVGSRRYSRRELVVRWLRRNRLLLTAAGLVLAIGVVAIVSVTHERNAAVISARELLLLQARAQLRNDPTATIAWLKRYPRSGPNQVEVKGLADEAIGRMVAKHVWLVPEEITNVAFADDHALIVSTRDGALARFDSITGRRTEVGRITTAPLAVRPVGQDVLALDENRELWRFGARPSKLGRVEDLGGVVGIYVAQNGATKVSFAENGAAWIGEPAARYDDDYAIVDTASDSRIVYALTNSGELRVGTTTLEKRWTFPAKTWLQSSTDGSHYLAMTPGPTGDVGIWIGTANGAPVRIASSRACADAEEAAQWGDVTNDGKIAFVVRCGALTIYDVKAQTAIPVPDPRRISFTALSVDGRWFAASHGDGLELIELATGAWRRVEAGRSVSQLGFSRDGQWLFATGGDTVRVWNLPAQLGTAKLADDVTTNVAFSLIDDQHLLVRRNLDCTVWNLDEKRSVSHANITFAESRGMGEESWLWPQSVAADGTRCSFSGREGRTIVATNDGTKYELAFEQCVLSSDGRTASCSNAESLVTVDIATDRVLSSRAPDGEIHNLIRFRGVPLAYIARTADCALETFAGEVFATAPRQAGECHDAYPVDDNAIVFRTGKTTRVWTESGSLDIDARLDAVHPSANLVAVVRGERLELWDVRSKQRIASPPPRERAIADVVWSRAGIVAASDDETIQLWDSAMHRAHTIVAPGISAMVWSRDGRTLHATDGRVMYSWTVEPSTWAGDPDLDEITTARIVDGHPRTP